MEKDDERIISKIIYENEFNIKYLNNVLKNPNFTKIDTEQYLKDQLHYFKLVILYNTNLLKISDKLKKEPENSINLMNMILTKIQNKIETLIGYDKENVDENFYIKTHTIFKEHRKYYENQFEIFKKLKDEN
jgi:hypothetical protein